MTVIEPVRVSWAIACGDPKLHVFQRCDWGCPDRVLLGDDHCRICGCVRSQHSEKA